MKTDKSHPDGRSGHVHAPPARATATFVFAPIGTVKNPSRRCLWIFPNRPGPCYHSTCVCASSSAGRASASQLTLARSRRFRLGVQPFAFRRESRWLDHQPGTVDQVNWSQFPAVGYAVATGVRRVRADALAGREHHRSCVAEEGVPGREGTTETTATPSLPFFQCPDSTGRIRNRLA